MERKAPNKVAYVLFLLLGLGITAWLFSEQDLESLGAILADTRWRYVWLSLLLTLGGHGLRALRWRQLLAPQTAAEQAAPPYLIALMNGYLVNLALPRIGELTRCISLHQMIGTPVVRSGATVILERVLDLICLLLVLLAAFAWAGPELGSFLEEQIYLPLTGKMAGKAGLLWALALAMAMGIAATIFLLRFPARSKMGRFLQRQARELKAGFTGLLRMPHKWRFLLYTFLIWLSYCSAPLLTIYALGLDDAQVLEVGFVAFAVGSIARTVPAPAGSMGPYHWLVMHALLLYGFSDSAGLAVATLNHAIQTGFYLLAGGLSFILLPIWQRKNT